MRGAVMLDRIIYVTGYGRSGSTLLDMMLGAHPQVFGAGEMSTICRHVWPNDEYCACHARVRACPLWSDAVTEWQASGIDLDRHAMLQRRIEPILSHARRGAALRDYCDQTLALYRIVARRTGRPVLLDSSKSPGRALALARAGVDLRLIHLVRDPRAVAHSMSVPMQVDTEAGVQKTLPAHPVARTALRWSFVNAGAEAALRRIAPAHGLRLRYEDLVADPQGALARIGATVGLDLDAVGAAIAAGGTIAAEHQVAGSRIRMTGAMTLRPDMGWQRRMSPRAQAVVAGLCGARMRRYGYAAGGTGSASA
ncbi:sulfotransferase family protein [Paracoccus sphaerophysae]|uniref:Sulfotransferase n=1 Tax=Paracoccus sphaerophysae TaxID=690417 RepID=A0A099FHL7_9RHOB|nr:sulfotransferase [Paracoccus sphaerophysae]KGJ09522.1 hypothetical protein IC63_01815 [Paracoccus sphaerophysae]